MQPVVFVFVDVIALLGLRFTVRCLTFELDKLLFIVYYGFYGTSFFFLPTNMLVVIFSLLVEFREVSDYLVKLTFVYALTRSTFKVGVVVFCITFR